MKYDYERLYNDIVLADKRSKLYQTVKRAVTTKGHWKQHPRGSYASLGIIGPEVARRREQQGL